MRVSFAYLGRSRMVESSVNNGRTLSILPNLAREKVSFDAALLHPLRFREAISALHDVVINDLRFKPRDKTDYEAWKKEQAAAKQALYRSELERATQDLATQRGLTLPPDFQELFGRTRSRYWKARRQLADLLRRDDPELWRWLVPCDPVITVADDVVFFECFSADESSYGCLTVSREGFGPARPCSLAPPMWITRGISITNFKPCDRTAKHDFCSIRRGSRSRLTTRPDIVRKRSICPEAGCAVS